MKILSTSNLKVEFLGITPPILEDKMGTLKPQEVVSFSALATFKGRAIQNLLKEMIERGQDVNKRIKNILRRSSLRGHASLATTPTLCFSFEGSKFLDSALTGMVFGSFLMASGRRTDTPVEDIVYPSTILKNKKAQKIYKKISEKNIIFYNWLLSQGIHKDEASKILQYGIYGTGLVQYPIEALISLKREYEMEKNWMPEEVGFLIEKLESQLKKKGVDLLYTTRYIAPRNTYPFPNIFKDPKRGNLVRDLIKTNGKNTFRIISDNFIVTPEFKKRLLKLKNDIQKTIKSKKNIKKRWLNLLLTRGQIIRDYQTIASVKVLSSVAWRVWSEKKRHRTVPMVAESIYYCLDKATKVLKKYKNQIKNKKLTRKELEEINLFFSIPLMIYNNPRFLYNYLERALDSLETYYRLINLGIKPPDALFIVPRGLKIDVIQDFNLYNLITGYYPLRICATAEEEIRRLSIEEVAAIKKILRKKRLKWLAEHLVPKCHLVGFCLEEEFCGLIKSLVPDYDEVFHQEMKDNLEQKFQESLKSLEK